MYKRLLAQYFEDVPDGLSFAEYRQAYLLLVQAGIAPSFKYSGCLIELAIWKHLYRYQTAIFEIAGVCIGGKRHHGVEASSIGWQLLSSGSIGIDYGYEYVVDILAFRQATQTIDTGDKEIRRAVYTPNEREQSLGLQSEWRSGFKSLCKVPVYTGIVESFDVVTGYFLHPVEVPDNIPFLARLSQAEFNRKQQNAEADYYLSIDGFRVLTLPTLKPQKHQLGYGYKKTKAKIAWGTTKVGSHSSTSKSLARYALPDYVAYESRLYGGKGEAKYYLRIHGGVVYRDYPQGSSDIVGTIQNHQDTRQFMPSLDLSTDELLLDRLANFLGWQGKHTLVKGLREHGEAELESTQRAEAKVTAIGEATYKNLTIKVDSTLELGSTVTVIIETPKPKPDTATISPRSLGTLTEAQIKANKRLKQRQKRRAKRAGGKVINLA